MCSYCLCGIHRHSQTTSGNPVSRCSGSNVALFALPAGGPGALLEICVRRRFSPASPSFLSASARAAAVNWRCLSDADHIVEDRWTCWRGVNIELHRYSASLRLSSYKLQTKLFSLAGWNVWATMVVYPRLQIIAGNSTGDSDAAGAVVVAAAAVSAYAYHHHHHRNFSLSHFTS